MANLTESHRGYQPPHDPHPLFGDASNFFNVSVERRGFFVDPESRDYVPAFLLTLFRYLHVHHLRSLCENPPTSFILELDDLRESHYPEEFRNVARFLAFQARSYEDCLSIVEQFNPHFIFHLLKAFLEITQPPILYLDFDTCIAMEEANVLYPLGTFVNTEMDSLFPFTFFSSITLRQPRPDDAQAYHQRLSMQMASVNCHVFKDLMSLPSAFHRSVVRNVFSHLCYLIREYAIIACNDSNIEMDHFFMPKAVRSNESLLRLVSTLVYHLAESLICLDSRWVHYRAIQNRRPMPEGLYVWMNQEESRMKRRAMMNILCTNIECLWFRGTTLKDFRFDDASNAIVDLFEGQVMRASAQLRLNFARSIA